MKEYIRAFFEGLVNLLRLDKSMEHHALITRKLVEASIDDPDNFIPEFQKNIAMFHHRAQQRWVWRAVATGCFVVLAVAYGAVLIAEKVIDIYQRLGG